MPVKESDSLLFSSLGEPRQAFHPVIVLLLQAAAFWAAWRSIAARLSHTAEPFWEMLPLFSVVILSWWNGRERSAAINSGTLILASLAAVFYAASFAFAPPLARAGLAFLSVTFVISAWRYGKRFHLGVFILLLLALPLTDSLNFYLGFPMRVVVGEAAVILLKMQGLNVIREGVILHLGQHIISIDAPCSGIKMLWFGTFLATASATLLKLSNVRIVLVLAGAFLVIMIGNVFRASSLFYLETGIIDGPLWMHSATGVVTFSFTSAAIIWMTVRLTSEAEWRK